MHTVPAVGRRMRGGGGAGGVFVSNAVGIVGIPGEIHKGDHA